MIAAAASSAGPRNLMPKFLAYALLSLVAVTAASPLAASSSSVAAVATPLAPPASATAVLEPAEVIHYDWELGGFLGGIASLFLPGEGVGTLTTRSTERGQLETILHITTQEDTGEYWTYGSLIGADGSPLRAWSAYTFRGESKHKETEVTTRGVQDIASSIYRLRQAPPQAETRLTIWSEGKLYPVLVTPRGVEDVKVGRGAKVRARHYSFRGIEEPGARVWKGRLDLWLAEDAASTPVVIVVERSLARVRLVRDPSSRPMSPGG
jgi:hypothetical protein